MMGTFLLMVWVSIMQSIQVDPKTVQDMRVLTGNTARQLLPIKHLNTQRILEIDMRGRVVLKSPVENSDRWNSATVFDDGSNGELLDAISPSDGEIMILLRNFERKETLGAGTLIHSTCRLVILTEGPAKGKCQIKKEIKIALNNEKSIDDAAFISADQLLVRSDNAFAKIDIDLPRSIIAESEVVSVDNLDKNVLLQRRSTLRAFARFLTDYTLRQIISDSEDRLFLLEASGARYFLERSGKLIKIINGEVTSVHKFERIPYAWDVDPRSGHPVFLSVNAGRVVLESWDIQLDKLEFGTLIPHEQRPASSVALVSYNDDGTICLFW